MPYHAFIITLWPISYSSDIFGWKWSQWNSADLHKPHKIHGFPIDPKTSHVGVSHPNHGTEQNKALMWICLRRWGAFFFHSSNGQPWLMVLMVSWSTLLECKLWNSETLMAFFHLQSGMGFDLAESLVISEPQYSCGAWPLLWIPRYQPPSACAYQMINERWNGDCYQKGSGVQGMLITVKAVIYHCLIFCLQLGIFVGLGSRGW